MMSNREQGNFNVLAAKSGALYFILDVTCTGGGGSAAGGGCDLAVKNSWASLASFVRTLYSLALLICFSAWR